MTRHPTARRVHREAAPDDVFVARVLETSAWARKHGRTLIIAGSVAAVVIIGTVFFLTTRHTRNVQAATQLTQVRAVALSGNTALAIRELEQFLDRFGGSSSADEARLMLGKAYLDVGQNQQAQQTVRPMTGDIDTGMGLTAAMLLAASYEAAQEPHRAEEVYIRIGAEAQFLFQKQDGLDNAARIRLQRGDAAGAAELYERLIEMTPVGDPIRAAYELRLGEAQTAAAVGGTTNAAPPVAPPAATLPPAPGLPAAPAPSTTPAPGN